MKNIFNELKKVRNKNAAFGVDWDSFVTKENLKSISTMSKEELREFKKALVKIDNGMTIPEIREAFAINPNEDPEELHEAISDEDPNVMLFALENPSISRQDLKDFLDCNYKKFDVSPDLCWKWFPETKEVAEAHLETEKQGIPYVRRFSKPIYKNWEAI